MLLPSRYPGPSIRNVEFVCFYFYHPPPFVFPPAKIDFPHAARAANQAEQEIYQFGDIISLWEDMDVEQKHQVGKLMLDKIMVFNNNVQILWKYNFMETQISA